ncbi:MAG: DesA/ISL3 alpha bundle tail domain-containing protein [Gammaproteobacteria bacterium]
MGADEGARQALSLSRETQLDALHEWCRRAEATGIEGLKIFADGLRGYSMVQRGFDQ